MPGHGGARPGAGRKRGGKNRGTLKREAAFAKAAQTELMPVEFLLSEMRDPTVPREERRLIAKWVAPFITPRLSAVAAVKSVHAMTDEELDWAIADAQRPGPQPVGWHPRVIDNGR
jgi:hypothetical protein